MKGLVLATVLHKKETLKYISNFERIVRETSPRLTPSDIKALCSKKPIVGQVLEECFGYERVLKLRRFETIKEAYQSADNNIEFVVGNIATDRDADYGLSIGSKNSCIEIFQEAYDRRGDVYNTDKDYLDRTNWVQVPEPFLQKTHGFLISPDQQRFKKLLQ